MKILMIAAEVVPFSTVGGLSQVIYFLSRSLIRQGHDVRIFTPKYGIITPKKPFRELIHHLAVPTSYKGSKHPQELFCNVLVSHTIKNQPKVYFLENREYYELRENVYQYSDDHIRFFLLSRGCLEWLLHNKKNNDWLPDIIHAHDWHTSYLCQDIRTNPRYKQAFRKTPLLLTSHNFHLQGLKNFIYLPKEERDTGKTPLHHFFHKKLVDQNPLLRGIIHCDWINTVSETHSREVLTYEYGEGLEETLLKYRGKLSGILNGLDTKEFNPSTDPLIKQNYSRSSIGLRAKNKADLQREFSLPVKEEIPLFAYSGRLSKQKGMNLLIEVMPHLMSEFDLQFIILGNGDNYFRQEFNKLSKQFPKKVGVHLYSNFKLPRKIFAGSDMIVLPSLFEPGGIVAIEAMRYGAVPIVRKTGGLADIVTDYSFAADESNGIVFENANPWAFFSAIVRGLTLYNNKQVWKKLVQNTMSADFSWDAVAEEYHKLYRRVSRQRKQLISDNPHPSRFP